MARQKVPVTGAVVDWAIRESGYSIDELAEKLHVSPDTIRAWVGDKEQPGLTQLRNLANKLKRPLAAFLLPKPPVTVRPLVEFRSPPGAGRRRELNPAERRYVREASRLQQFLSWLAGEVGEPSPTLSREQTRENPAAVSRRVRERFGVDVRDQVDWPSPSAAFAAWRQALENSGVLVLVFSMGRESCRGFSLWDERVPLIAVNTTDWPPSARIFTLFHEYGHLATRTNSACLQGWRRLTSVPEDSPERWCEEFSATLLMPEEAVRPIAERLHDLDPESLSTAIANHFKVSRLAAALRLVELGFLTWKNYEDLPRVEVKRQGGGKGRDRAQLREDQYGSRATHLVSRGIERDVIGRGEVLDYFDVPEPSLEQLVGLRDAGE